jgi:antitoxin YefM
MKVVSLSELRANMAKHFDSVEEDRDELIVTRQNREPMVVMSLADFESWKETTYLLSNPRNRDRLLKSIGSFQQDGIVTRTIDELLTDGK